MMRVASRWNRWRKYHSKNWARRRLRIQNLGGGEVTNVACKQSRLLKTNSCRECAVEIALTRSTFQPKMH